MSYMEVYSVITVSNVENNIMRNLCCKVDGTPKCTCGGRVKPDVVLYEEGLDMDVINGAVRAISDADMLIVGGTSLVVYPAAGLIHYYRGKRLVVINKTELSAGANLTILGSIGEVLSQIKV